MGVGILKHRYARSSLTDQSTVQRYKRKNQGQFTTTPSASLSSREKKTRATTLSTNYTPTTKFTKSPTKSTPTTSATTTVTGNKSPLIPSTSRNTTPSRSTTTPTTASTTLPTVEYRTTMNSSTNGYRTSKHEAHRSKATTTPGIRTTITPANNDIVSTKDIVSIAIPSAIFFLLVIAAVVIIYFRCKRGKNKHTSHTSTTNDRTFRGLQTDSDETDGPPTERINMNSNVAMAYTRETEYSMIGEVESGNHEPETRAEDDYLTPVSIYDHDLPDSNQSERQHGDNVVSNQDERKKDSITSSIQLSPPQRPATLLGTLESTCHVNQAYTGEPIVQSETTALTSAINQRQNSSPRYVPMRRSSSLVDFSYYNVPKVQSSPGCDSGIESCYNVPSSKDDNQSPSSPDDEQDGYYVVPSSLRENNYARVPTSALRREYQNDKTRPTSYVTPDELQRQSPLDGDCPPSRLQNCEVTNQTNSNLKNDDSLEDGEMDDNIYEVPGAMNGIMYETSDQQNKALRLTSTSDDDNDFKEDDGSEDSLYEIPNRLNQKMYTIPGHKYATLTSSPKEDPSVLDQAVYNVPSSDSKIKLAKDTNPCTSSPFSQKEIDASQENLSNEVSYVNSWVSDSIGKSESCEKNTDYEKNYVNSGISDSSNNDKTVMYVNSLSSDCRKAAEAYEKNVDIKGDYANSYISHSSNDCSSEKNTGNTEHYMNSCISDTHESENKEMDYQTPREISELQAFRRVNEDKKKQEKRQHNVLPTKPKYGKPLTPKKGENRSAQDQSTYKAQTEMIVDELRKFKTLMNPNSEDKNVLPTKPKYGKPLTPKKGEHRSAQDQSTYNTQTEMIVDELRKFKTLMSPNSEDKNEAVKKIKKTASLDSASTMSSPQKGKRKALLPPSKPSSPLIGKKTELSPQPNRTKKTDGAFTTNKAQADHLYMNSKEAKNKTSQEDTNKPMNISKTETDVLEFDPSLGYMNSKILRENQKQNK